MYISGISLNNSSFHVRQFEDLLGQHTCIFFVVYLYSYPLVRIRSLSVTDEVGSQLRNKECWLEVGRDVC